MPLVTDVRATVAALLEREIAAVIAAVMTPDELDEAVRAEPTVVAIELTGVDWYALKADQDARPTNEPSWGRHGEGLTFGGIKVFVGSQSRVWSEARWLEVWGSMP